MKKIVFILAGITLFICANLPGQTDNAREEAAIKAVIEADRAAYLNRIIME